MKEYWLLDPMRKSAEFYIAGADGICNLAALDENGRYHSTQLPGLWIQVDWLRQSPLPPLLHVSSKSGS